MVTTVEDAKDLMVALVTLSADPTQYPVEPLLMGQSAELSDAISRSDTSWLYRCLIDGFSYQGIRDSHARAYIAKHGNAEWHRIAQSLAVEALCPKLADFDSYRGCRYRKATQSCANPDDLTTCPVPQLTLRKGVLNEQAFSLYFFIRDECGGDLVAYIDRHLELAELDDDASADGREMLLAGFTQIVGVSRKLAGMMLSQILLNAGPDRPRWHAVGASIVVVDSLVHNFLHRTGILAAYQAEHLYGERCYGATGCEVVIRTLAMRLADENQPQSPRALQHAIWRFCAADELAVCNGNNIRDTAPCQFEWCQLRGHCSRLPLRPGPIVDGEA